MRNEMQLYIRLNVSSEAQLRVSYKEHGAIVAALVAGDCDACGAAFERHILNGKRRLLDSALLAHPRNGPVISFASTTRGRQQGAVERRLQMQKPEPITAMSTLPPRCRGVESMDSYPSIKNHSRIFSNLRSRLLAKQPRPLRLPLAFEGPGDCLSMKVVFPLQTYRDRRTSKSPQALSFPKLKGPFDRST